MPLYVTLTFLCLVLKFHLIFYINIGTFTFSLFASSYLFVHLFILNLLLCFSFKKVNLSTSFVMTELWLFTFIFPLVYLVVFFPSYFTFNIYFHLFSFLKTYANFLVL